MTTCYCSDVCCLVTTASHVSTQLDPFAEQQVSTDDLIRSELRTRRLGRSLSLRASIPLAVRSSTGAASAASPQVLVLAFDVSQLVLP